MADDSSKKTAPREDPRIMAARQRAADLSKAGPGLTSPANIAQFFKDTWTELKKTTWPDRPTLLKSTYIVLAFIAFTAIWVGAIDAVLTDLTKGLFKS